MGPLDPGATRCPLQNAFWTKDYRMTSPADPLRRRAAAGATRAGGFRRLLAWADGRPFLAVLAAAAALQLPFLGLRELWWSDELRHAGVLWELREHGHWWALRLNGAFYPDKPPAYFLLLAGLQALLGAGPWVMFLGLSLTVAAAGAATLRLGLVAGLGARGALLGALMFLTSAYVIALGHYARMDFLFAALIVLSWASLLRALDRPEAARGAILWGAAWASLAFLVKGPVGIGLPALAFMAEALRRGRFGVMRTGPVWAGAGIAAATMALWALGVHLLGGPGALRVFWDSQIVGRATGEAVGGHGGLAGLLRYVWMLPLLLLPWSLLWLLRAPAAPLSSRPFLWLAVVTGLVPLSLLGEKHDYYLLPLLAPASVLLAARLGALPEAGRRGFARLAAGLLLVGGVAFLLAPMALGRVDGAEPLGPALRGLGVAGVLALLAAGGLAWLGARGAAWGVMAASAVVTTAGLLGVAGPLTAVLSPREVAAEMRPWVEAGHAPGALHGIDGVFQAALGGRYAWLPDGAAARDWLGSTERGVLALEAREWAEVATEGWAVVGCASFLGEAWAVAVRPAPDGQAECGEPGDGR